MTSDQTLLINLNLDSSSIKLQFTILHRITHLNIDMHGDMRRRLQEPKHLLYLRKKIANMWHYFLLTHHGRLHVQAFFDLQNIDRVHELIIIIKENKKSICIV